MLIKKGNISMIYRNIYTAQLQDGAHDEFVKALDGCKRAECIVSLSVMCWKQRVFLYYETRDCSTLAPDDIFINMEQYLEKWPGEAKKRLWVPMFDIFHYNRPVDDEEWMRHTPSEPFGMMMRIRPEKLSSYIFYHYQMQEETPGMGNKYGIICMHENLLFHYLERPDIDSKLCFKGKLTTNNTPSNWGELMDEHFAPWEDTEPPIQWRKDVETVFHFEKIIPLPEKYN